jgi:hypothetical protein
MVSPVASRGSRPSLLFRSKRCVLWYSVKSNTDLRMEQRTDHEAQPVVSRRSAARPVASRAY